MEVGKRFKQIAHLEPGTLALEYQGRGVAFGAAAQAVGNIVTLLGQAGVAPGQPVGLIGRNHPGSVIGLTALFIAGYPVEVLNPLQPEAKLAGELEQLKLAAVIAEPGDWTKPLLEAAAHAGTLGLQVSPFGEEVGLHPALAKLGAGPFHKLRDGMAVEIQTSGTTGEPKRVMLASRVLESAMLDGIRSANIATELATPAVKRSPTLLFLPIVNASGMFATLLSLYEGRPIVLFDKFNVAEFRAALHTHKPRFASLPPTILRMVLDSEISREDMASLIAIRCGTAPLEPATQMAFEEKFGVPVLINYGATEFMGAVAGWTLDEYKKFGKDKRGSVGRPRRGIKLQVVDADTGTELPRGEVGILEVDASKTGIGEGWTRTTDRAAVDADGFLFMHGRADDAIIRGGFKVSGGQVSDALRTHPAVRDAIVLGVPDERLGEVPVAIVEFRPDVEAVSEAVLIAYAKTKLVAYQVPVRVFAVPELPRTISLKISRPAVRELLDRFLAPAQD